ncbi:Ubiquitin carboxyl-terminal hydrolase 42 [Saguinus oedipus]|uniref:Ubiquitin carboxyl-terminal hydrolase 42 n=1 Tax=Saguinus oedipus TaxID=9490 RepID=A0ABQ9W652_SAGOE|nr:Ubiquitin carboxyl-terminal hydrolase 42 [Saguinus oedipus]
MFGVHSAPGAERGPSEDCITEPQPGSPASESLEELDLAASPSSTKVPPHPDPGTPATKEGTWEAMAAASEEPPPSAGQDIITGDTTPPDLCDPGSLTGDPSPLSQDMGIIVEGPRDSVSAEAQEGLSPAPPMGSEESHEQPLLVHPSRDHTRDAQDPPQSSGAPEASEGPPAPALEVAPSGHPVGDTEPSPGEKGEDTAVGPKAPGPSPTMEKIGSLRKVDRGHYRSRRERSSSGEPTRESRSKTEGQGHRHRRHRTCARERDRQDRHTSEHHPGHGDRLSPGERRSLGRYGHHHSRHRSGAEPDWGRHHYAEGEHSWGREKFYPDRLRWDRCRYYHDRYALYAARDWKPFHSGREYERAGLHERPHKDHYRGRRGSPVQAHPTPLPRTPTAFPTTELRL